MSDSTPSEPEARPTPDAPGERAGDVIDRYTLVEEIGEGGMGTVWKAEQSEPVKREVALKVIKLGMDTREVVVRFEAERQALALMDHPHIAKVFDGGATQSGRPYFVMELVRGTPITEHCDSAQLDLRERLELFIKVCEAVQHAHQKGVIHRDIKPSNVLVRLHDKVAEPKVIDFGIAKATSAELTQETMFTQNAQILGTPEYMAPEQAEMSGHDIDTRADVYALGALLYEMLTGTKLFNMNDALQAGWQELLRLIQEVDPPKPSTRVSTMGEAASSIALRRHVNVDALRKKLTGDLDWIVMKSLEKDRARRYETANAFAEDVARFLNQEPVAAAPPSTLYRFRKLVRRRRKTVAVMAAILVLVVAGSVGTGVGWWNTKQANKELQRQRNLAQENERRARDAETEARTAEGEEKKQRQLALERAEQLEQVVAFQRSQLRGLNLELMGSAMRSSLLALGPVDDRDFLARSLEAINFTTYAMRTLHTHIFERTVQAIDRQFEDRPLIRADLLDQAATTMEELGLFEAALGPRERATDLMVELHGEDASESWEAKGRLGVLLRQRGEYDRGEAVCREALAGLRRLTGADSRPTIHAMDDLAALLFERRELDEAEILLREALEMGRASLGVDDPSILVASGRLASVRYSMGHLEEAEGLFRETLAQQRRVLGEDDREAIATLASLGSVLTDRGKTDEAMECYRAAWEAHQRVLGDDHPDTIASHVTFALLLQTLERREEAATHLDSAIEAYNRVLGKAHADTLVAMDKYGSVLRELGRLDEAEPYVEAALDQRLELLGDRHPETLDSLETLSDLRREQGRVQEAEELCREIIEARREIQGADHLQTLKTAQNLSALLIMRGALEEAELYGREATEGRRRVLGDKHFHTLVSINNLGIVLQRQGRLSEARLFFGEALDGYRALRGDEHPHTRTFHESLRVVLSGLLDEAMTSNDSLAQARAYAELGSFHVRMGRSSEAEPALGEAYGLFMESDSEADPLRWLAQGELGAVLAEQELYEEAASMITESVDWFLARPSDIDVRVGVWPGDPATWLIEALIDLYTAWDESEPGAGHDALADTWRGRRDRR